MNIWRNRTALGYMGAGAVLTLAVASLMPNATAQNKTAGNALVAQQEGLPPFPGQGGFPGGGQGGGFPGGPGGRQGGGFPGGPGMMGMGGGGASLTATDKYVYVLRGNTLYQFSTDGLKLLAKAELPRPEMQQRGGPGGPPDGRGGGEN